MTELDRRVFLAAGAAWLAAPLGSRPSSCSGPAPRHAALFVYTRPPPRARHAVLVQQALALRARVHTSAWRKGPDARPVLEIGPVPRGAALYHGEAPQGPVYRTWPFVVVLEYDGDDHPTAYVDWFRRSRDSADPAAWLLDPGIGYADHHNEQLVTESDRRWCYLAMADTPTDSHVGGTQWAVRARVRWQDGTRVQKGWWLRFEAPETKPAAEWRVEQTPLVDWRIDTEVPGRGIVATASVADPDRELAVLGTPTVFRFPDVPPGVTAGKGRG